MTLAYGKSRLLLPALLAASIGLIGCGGGGGSGGSGSTPETRITVIPERFDFGTITEGNEDQALPRQFIIRNEGTTSYNIEDIRVRRDNFDAFFLDRSGGSAPCGTRPFDLAPGDSCTVVVEFKTQHLPLHVGKFDGLLIAESDNPNIRTVGSTLAGTYEPIKSIHVTVNQVNDCALPAPQAFQAFVSVTDQAQFPISHLAEKHFTLVELESGPASNLLDVIDVGQVGDINLSLSIAMDYSGSITDFPDAVGNMEAGATSLVDAMKDDDDADIIKYADDVQPMTTEFTSDKDILKAAINNPPALDRDTAFYDATVEAIKRFDTANSTHDRKAVIALTDGEDTIVDDTEAALGGAIDQALGADIPVFTIGFGEFLQEAQEDELQRLADGTGGLFYELASDANLQQVFQQLASLLFKYQYVIDFDGLSGKEGSSLEVTVEYVDKYGETLKADGDKPIQACSVP
ncbi:VWA domain-containing protein [Thioalkalivibrio sp. AKL10]|uniref:VWA domain-containing protein n=1 Tax=Thioalkalivibrio sp. AKL10 TaxID=1158158 RepID=UPI0003696E88|nr:VWA domain-containing protein [Thioalkalivibrio sp. AKL10]